MKEHKLIFSPWFRQYGGIINYLDVGARGDVSEPWSLFAPEAIKVIGFEPDPDECERLSALYPGRAYYPNALWSEKSTRPFYLCEWPSTSSMYPPAEEANEQYRSTHWTGRVPAKTLSVDCMPLDDVLSKDDAPDFIKIDTQGAELEILRGAEQVLKDGSPLVLAETWCTEVYKGAPLTHDVMQYMFSLGYQVFDVNVAAAWQHQTKSLPQTRCKAKTVGFDLLFVKKKEFYKPLSVSQALKFAALCELYGFRDFAVAILEEAGPKTPLVSQAIGEMCENERCEGSFSNKLRAIVLKVLRRKSVVWPQLH